MKNPEPQREHIIGSATVAAKAVATAMSAALPPALATRPPAAAVNGESALIAALVNGILCSLFFVFGYAPIGWHLHGPKRFYQTRSQLQIIPLGRPTKQRNGQRKRQRVEILLSVADTVY
jgi:hypothetical protein